METSVVTTICREYSAIIYQRSAKNILIPKEVQVRDQLQWIYPFLLLMDCEKREQLKLTFDLKRYFSDYYRST